MIPKILRELGGNLDNPEWLSKACVYLSSELYTFNTEMATEELKEKTALVELLNKPLSDGEKKISVAEAEKQAVVTTANNYGIMKVQNEAIIETINSIKKRIEVLSWERKQTQ